MSHVITDIRRELKENIDEKTLKNSAHFFKEKVKVYGVKTAVVTKIGKSYLKMVKQRPKAEIFALCEKLWQSGYMEESWIACQWSHAIHKQYEPTDFKVFERWVDNHVTNWASCDTLCNHTIGEFLQMYPEYVPSLKKWAKSKNRWMQREAAVSLIIPARRGKFLNEILEIADILLVDEDDLVQKGYGWMLKVASKSYQKEIFDYVMANKAVMPRTALRYAIEKMPAELRAEAMVKEEK